MNIEKPKLIIIAGPNGSGKTSVTNNILEHEWIEGCVYINPDIIAQDGNIAFSSVTIKKKLK